jgi:hypothetical protein
MTIYQSLQVDMGILGINSPLGFHAMATLIYLQAVRFKIRGNLNED